MEQNPYLTMQASPGGELAKSILPLLNLLAELLRRLLDGLGNPARRHGLLTPEDVTAMLRISDRTLRRYSQQGILHPIRIGGMNFYLMDDIIESGRSDGSAG
ncbi:helix-turn-helix domain-containing protein [Parapedobacter deserti]|uniref:Helix-turn-helix domain-containing protein n=1 Tax=Parapedobacter deserti TaxID=1912957 RepID=A0ABV7JSI5_9SPHI